MIEYFIMAFETTGNNCNLRSVSSSKCDKWTLVKDVENNPPLLEDMGLCPLDKGDQESTKIILSSNSKKVLQPLCQNSQNIEETSGEFFVFKRRRLDTITGEDKFNKLLDEVVLMVFKWLPKHMLVKCAQVCKRWKLLAFDESLWRQLDLGHKTVNAGVIGRVILRGTCTLRLSRAEISRNVFSPPLHHLPPSKIRCNLQNLDLSMAAIEVEALEELFSICFNLKRLSLEHLTVSNECCRYIARNSNLDTLNMAMCYGLNAAGLSQILQNCQKLQSLNIAWTNLTSKDLTAICKSFPPSLLRLNLSGCRTTLNDCHIRSLVQNVPSLLELDVSEAGFLTDATVKLLIKKLKFLEYLAFARCFNIPISSYLDLRFMPNLLYLDVFGLLNDKALHALKESLPKIKINEFLFSSVARPTVGLRRTSIWGIRVRD